MLSLHIPRYASLSKISQVILGYPISENLYWDILGYPDLPSRSFFQMEGGGGITNENRKLHLERAIPASFAPNALTCHFMDAKDVCRDQESLRL